jgi:alanine racemase
MTLRLTIDRDRWLDHVQTIRASVDGAGELVPVIKGNGYGIGIDDLARLATEWAGLVAVGTVHEAQRYRRCADERVLVLTPSVRPTPLPPWAIPTVANEDHLDALADTASSTATLAAGTRSVAVKLLSSMSRYGIPRADLASLERAIGRRGVTVHSYVLHLPLLGGRRTIGDQVAEIEAWLPGLDPSAAVSVSHLDVASFRQLAAHHPDRHLQLRLGSSLWHGDKSFLHLGADVIEVRAVTSDSAVGYRGVPVPGDGWLVMIGAGSSHGVSALADGRSPFHHRRRRIDLVEAPHMHTSMCFVPADVDPPAIGDWVDVQRPLISVQPDEVVWS